MTTNRASRLATLALTGIFAFAACGGGASSSPGDEPTDAPIVPTEAPAITAEPLSGTITIDGSSTVFPITEVVAEEFQIANPGVQVPVAFSGTGGGFKKFCVGETDINDASRPIKAEDEGEGLACATNGIECVELQVAIDGLTVVVNPDNDVRRLPDDRPSSRRSTARTRRRTCSGATSTRPSRPRRSSASCPAPTRAPSTTSPR